MLYVYLFATILGGVLLGTTLFGGGDHDAGHDADHGDHGFGIFSLRLWTYFFAFGGLTGLLLTTLTGTWAPITAALSLGMGAVSGVTARTIMVKALTSGAGSTIKHDELVGKSAEVLVPFARGDTGTVRLRVKGSTIDLMAAVEEDVQLAAKEEVLILEVKDGRALVTRNPAGKQLPAAAAAAAQQKLKS
jgi:hypothetical protein